MVASRAGGQSLRCGDPEVGEWCQGYSVMPPPQLDPAPAVHPKQWRPVTNLWTVQALRVPVADVECHAK